MPQLAEQQAFDLSPSGGQQRGAVTGSERRIIALVLPALLCELAESPGFIVPVSKPRNAADRTLPIAKGRTTTKIEGERAAGGRSSAKDAGQEGEARSRRAPLGVVLGEPAGAEGRGGDADSSAALRRPIVDEITATSVLSAVNELASRYGVRPGQTLTEARALTSRLVVRMVARDALEQGLARVCEIAFAFGATVSFEAPDTVWVDITGTAHLFGGEAALVAELVSRVREAGHRVRAALAAGPLLAQALARYGELGKEGALLVPRSELERELSRLPIRALGLPSKIESWLLRLGVISIAQLLELPRSALVPRLEEHACRVLDLIAGRDSKPLVPYVPTRVVSEASSWDEPVDGSVPLLFVLRGLSTRLGARLAGRGEAACRLQLEISSDLSVARFRNVAPFTRLDFSLPKPLWKSEEIYRVIASRLERLELSAPSLGLRLEVTELTEATPRQLELGLWGADTSQAVDELPIVLAELAADIGEKQLGVLRAIDSHRPELASALSPVFPNQGAKPRLKKARKGARKEPSLQVSPPEGAGRLVHRLTRLLLEPLPFEAPLRIGATVVLERRLYTIEALRFEQRLEAVEWWIGAVNRDYVRVELRGETGVIEGLVFVDRNTGKRYWQGVAD